MNWMVFAWVVCAMAVAALGVVGWALRLSHLERDAAKALLEVERVKAVEDHEAARPFVDLERDAWKRYEVAVAAARDLYNTELSRINAYRDSGIRERAKLRFLHKQAELLRANGLSDGT